MQLMRQPRQLILQLINAEAPQRQVMSDGTMPGLEPSLAQQRRAQQGDFDVSEEYQAAEADEALVGGDVSPPGGGSPLA
jgi:hypothetical protein